MDEKDTGELKQIYAIGTESAFTIMASRLKAGAEMQELDWDIIQDYITSIECSDEEGYHCVFHYLGTPLVFFHVPDEEEGVILIGHPTEPGTKLSDELLG